MNFSILSILIFSFVLINVDGFTLIDPLKSVWSSLYPQKTSSLSDPMSEISIKFSDEDINNCPGCMKNRVMEEIGDMDQVLNEIRVEYVKQQILKKLRLSKPPDVSISLSTLPKPLINGRVLELRPGRPLEPEKQAESFYGKTDQIVIFPNEGKSFQNINSFFDISIIFKLTRFILLIIFLNVFITTKKRFNRLKNPTGLIKQNR